MQTAVCVSSPGYQICYCSLPSPYIPAWLRQKHPVPWCS